MDSDRRRPAAAIDTTNDAEWTYTGGYLNALHPNALVRLSPERALVMAAWLVTLAEDHAAFSFHDALEAVRAKANRAGHGGYRGSLDRATEDFERGQVERRDRSAAGGSESNEGN
jgi:hypothetical protein